MRLIVIDANLYLTGAQTEPFLWFVVVRPRNSGVVDRHLCRMFLPGTRSKQNENVRNIGRDGRLGREQRRSPVGQARGKEALARGHRRGLEHN